MGSFNLCNGVVLFIIFYFFTLQVFSVRIDCEFVKNCTFAKNILSKRHISPSSKVWSLFKMSKCGYEKESSGLKIWCPKFRSCRTPTGEFGTCIPAQSCADLAIYLNVNVTAKLKDQLSDQQYICDPDEDTHLVHFCCPWTMKTSIEEMVNDLILKKEEITRRKKRQTSKPWFAYSSNGINFYDDGQNQYYQKDNDFELPKSNFAIPGYGLQPKTNIFGEQYTNFFDNFKAGQTNTMNSLQNSLQKQKQWFQSSLNDSSKKNSDATQHFYDGLLNSFKSSPRKNNDGNFNLTEETSESAQEICITPSNFEGFCKQIRECPSFSKALANVKATDVKQVEYLKKFRCNSTENHNIKVCCSENSVVLPSSNYRADKPESDIQKTTSNSLDSISNICGRQTTLDDKITGGTSTGLAEFPWTAVLYYTTSNNLTFGCGGTIISNRYIVTAAHCVNTNILRQAGLRNLQKVVLGEYDRKNESDCIYTRYGSDCAEPPQSFGVEQIVEHRLFQSNATPNDIALVRLDRNIAFSDYIRPICLPTKGSINISDNETVTIVGWGRTETGESSPVKRKARLPFISKNNCGQLGPLTEGQMCLGSGKGTDSCKGDSGGPVMIHTGGSSNNPVSILVGVISFGLGRCGTATSVSTYVPHYLDWIFTHVS